MIVLSIDESFEPCALKADASIYASVDAYVARLPDPKVTAMGAIVLRWLYLHSLYRLRPSQSHRLHAPCQVVSLACGLVVFLSQYFQDHSLNGAALLAGCEAWLVTVREACRAAETMRIEQSEVTH
jgi:hypothetical protein